MIDILVSAFLLSIVLVGIHAYFGTEIIRRGIIFTDLAIGQMAAMGAAVSILLFDSTFMYVFSLSFAILGGSIISFSSKRSLYPEAIIGLLYAFALSSVFLILSKSPHGSEEFNNLLATDILFTPLAKILETALLYSAIGFILFFIYRRVATKFRDLLFFTLFAITVTSSVKLAGVLVVFALLLSPVMIALSLKLRHILITAWIAGIVINLISIGISYILDLPTGYTLVAVNTLAALIISVLKTT